MISTGFRVNMRIMYTVLLYTYKALHECAPPYICELIELYVPRRSLRSSSRCMLDVPKIRTKKYRARQFSYATAILWNAISDDGLNNSEHVDDFKKIMKTYLFKEYFYFGTQPVQINF